MIFKKEEEGERVWEYIDLPSMIFKGEEEEGESVWE
jgi:hypothetical protein